MKQFFSNYFLAIPLFPSFWCAIACIGGITATTILRPYLFSLMLLTIFFPCLWLNTFSKKQLITMSALFLSCSLGYGRSSYLKRSFIESSETLITESPLSGKATVLDCTSATRRYKTCLTLQITSLSEIALPKRTTLRIYLKSRYRLLPGDQITFKNLTLKKNTNASFQWYLYKEGIVGSLYTDKLLYKKIHRPKISFSRWRSGLRQRIAQSIAKKLSPDARTLFLALFLGSKKRTQRFYALRSVFSWWGIVHYLARSGLHVVVLASSWSLFFSYIKLPTFMAHILLLLFMSIYYLLSWPSISFNRAFIAFLFYNGFKIGGRSFQLIHIIALTALITLINNPFQLFFLDFQLSFGLSCALAWLSEASHQIRIAKP